MGTIPQVQSCDGFFKTKGVDNEKKKNGLFLGDGVRMGRRGDVGRGAGADGHDLRRAGAAGAGRDPLDPGDLQTAGPVHRLAVGMRAQKR